MVWCACMLSKDTKEIHAILTSMNISNFLMNIYKLGHDITKPISVRNKPRVYKTG